VIIHADMPAFSEYRVTVNQRYVTPQIYMADDVHGVVITRHWSSAYGGFVYARQTGQVRIIHVKTSGKRPLSSFGRRVARLR
jgi:hypothetical protein